MEFIKTYRTPAAAQQAQAHQTWLAQLGMPVAPVLARHGRHLVLARVNGSHLVSEQLPEAALLLGRAHTAAHQRFLTSARLGEGCTVPDVGPLEPFTAPRIRRVRALLATGNVPGAVFTASEGGHLVASAADEPAAFYKDANPRNFLHTPTGIIAVDFDDLTLAPFGYDLAKLIVTTAMTYGPLPAPLTRRTINAYNRHVPYPVPPDRLNQWMEIHHILTSPYLGRNGYTRSWHTLRRETQIR
ncbi:phosphotransferase [Streptomyces sp. TLI_146]|uniref:phosphotransferase n=1 Tax=Streptomyces sp. TLI_146 TaxID=1938858 RepID=UPI000C7028A0|nr:phosphotransferase [Streptomyces sp. TLI_146]PKV84235.1 phosphotransferase family enzyme [Streptomyces sp. TLI_146]